MLHAIETGTDPLISGTEGRKTVEFISAVYLSLIHILPWNPGGSTDLTGRALADAMGKSMGTNIVVTNTPGSGGSVGSLTVQKAEKDGYNILANGMLRCV